MNAKEQQEHPDTPLRPDRRAAMAGIAAGGVAMAVGLPQAAEAQTAGNTAWGWKRAAYADCG